MKMRRGWYMRWANDHTETDWTFTCPVAAEAMRAHARRRSEKLIETPIKVLRPARYACIECQTTHA